MRTLDSHLSILQDPIAEALLASRIPARLAYVVQGEPRVVPIWFAWTGAQLVMGSLAAAPKARWLAPGDPVAVSIDSNDFPYRSLSIRGTIDIEFLDTIAPEYASACRRYLGTEQGQAFLDGFPAGTKMWRFTVTPSWANLQDFETRFPSALVTAMGWKTTPDPVVNQPRKQGSRSSPLITAPAPAETPAPPDPPPVSTTTGPSTAG